jgi:hypothetical protein
MANDGAIDRAIRASGALVAVARQTFPLTVANADTEPFRLIGTAMLARGAGALESIAALAPRGYNTDSAVLLRVLTEHVIVFAWLSADPDRRVLLWLKEDARQRMAMHNDWLEGKPPLLDDWPRVWFERLKAVEGVMPDTRTCALQADECWLSRLPGVLSAATPETTLLGQYQVVFRSTSSSTHAGLMGLQPFIAETSLGTVVDLETSHAKELATTMAPVTYALGLHIASASLGYPEPAAIEAAVAELAAAEPP